ncbi:hypothetical protein HK100_006485, partial [Physocladia obscura]
MPHVPLNFTGLTDPQYANITPVPVIRKVKQTVPSLAPLLPQYPAPPHVNLPSLSALFPHMQNYPLRCIQHIHMQQQQQQLSP